MGHDPHGRRHATPAWLNMITEPDPMQRGKKLVVQMVETFQAGRESRPSWKNWMPLTWRKLPVCRWRQ
ncbi:malonate decarboxylase, alpha subunit [Salmonella enterica subsp. arizonae]|uniref:Malonate decarboxylase, alpha subunit n=1 Tax=Salmonella enterica subsp. arizonae TaxID=59203 RepID=A0A447QXX0_SALER|nr:malonate decarboxylase, alpha subunit [Salmonella enterica subsp. arizonae]